MQQRPLTELNPLGHMGVSGLSNGPVPSNPPAVLQTTPGLRKHNEATVLSNLRQVHGGENGFDFEEAPGGNC